MLRLLFALLILSCYSCDFANASGIVPVKNQEAPAITNNGSMKRYLKGSKTAAMNAENEERASTSSLKTLSQKVPHVDDAKAAVVKAAKEDGRIKALKSIGKGHMKWFAVVAAAGLVGGYVAYLVKK